MMNKHGHIIKSLYNAKGKENLRNNNFVAVSINIHTISQLIHEIFY
jgi:hypothetical protein